MYIATLMCTFEAQLNEKLLSVIDGFEGNPTEDLPYRNIYGSTIRDLRDSLARYFDMYRVSIETDEAIATMKLEMNKLLVGSLRGEIIKSLESRDVLPATIANPSDLIDMIEKSIGPVLTGVEVAKSCHIAFQHEGISGLSRNNVLVMRYVNMTPYLDEALLEDLDLLAETFTDYNSSLTKTSGLN